MTLQSSGAISLSQIAGEFGGKNPLELGEYYGQDNAPTSGSISFSNFYGTDGIPTSGLQYHYDGQISEHNDPSAGNVQDLGSSNYTGTLTNGAAYNTGNFGKVVFDGVDDYVNLSGYNGVTGTTARTSIVFFKLDASPPSAVQRLLSWGTASGGQQWSLEITTARQIRLAIGGASRLATKQLTTNTWNMIAATSSGGSSTTNITMYHNAEKLVNYNDNNSGTINTSSTVNVSIGRANSGGAGNVDGEIAKALIYNRELTHAEVAQIYNAKCVALGLSQAAASTETSSSPPTYSITQSATTIYETSGAGSPQSTTFTITTTNVANGTTLYWTCGGGNVSAADFTQNTTSGSFTINNNTGSVTLTARNDGVSDDKETFTLQVRTGSTSGTVVATSSTITINE